MPNQSNTTTLPINPDTGSYFLPQPPGGTRLQVGSEGGKQQPACTI